MSFRRKLFFKVPLILIVIAILGWIVMSLWNWIIPYLFVGAHAIDYARAIGLLVLSRILFGGFHGHRQHKPWRRWKQMTPEEREHLYKTVAGVRQHDDGQESK
ncbi:MAG: hypothetical protein WA777_07785 [Rhodanobacter sp.]